MTPTPLQVLVSVIVAMSGILSLFVKRWWGMQDNAILARQDAVDDAEHRCDERIDQLRLEHERRIQALEGQLSRMRAGIAELIPLVREEHQVTALQILWRISGDMGGIAGE